MIDVKTNYKNKSSVTKLIFFEEEKFEKNG